MAEEKIGREATETDQSPKATESYNSTPEKAGEYYDYEPASVTAGEYYEATRERAAELYDTATAKAGEVVARIRREERIASEVSRLLDVTGKPIEGHVEWRSGALGHATPEGFVNLTINRGEFDRLSTKTREILAEAALAQERIAKDQEEIDLLKAETRETLRRLRAA
jgi:hypothetical protein